MDAFALLVLAVIAVTAIYRLRFTYRRSTMNRNKGDAIRRKLEELRKKRDEE
ncbi:hypothetical protein [Gordoniibacillus kamchatkensis]|uniref:hypothetical protein n=1 Tax=Gordoniibacillus kamchatkensis TaxID=1590651 RepID=UPI000AA1866B|nr:hypothetical protein [Paenibacillus sp. VKM B-2647]